MSGDKNKEHERKLLAAPVMKEQLAALVPEAVKSNGRPSKGRPPFRYKDKPASQKQAKNGDKSSSGTTAFSNQKRDTTMDQQTKEFVAEAVKHLPTDELAKGFAKEMRTLKNQDWGSIPYECAKYGAIALTVAVVVGGVVIGFNAITAPKALPAA